MPPLMRVISSAFREVVRLCHAQSRLPKSPSPNARLGSAGAILDDVDDEAEGDKMVDDFFQGITNSHYDRIEGFADNVRRSWQRLRLSPQQLFVVTHTAIFTTSTCWILGAGSSYDCITSGLSCTPLTANILLPTKIDQNVIRSLKELSVRAPRDDIGQNTSTSEMLGSHLESTMDWLYGLCEDNDNWTADSASETLKELVEQIVTNIRYAQHSALLANGGRRGFQYSAENYLWLVSSLSFFPSWSIITLNFDSLVDRAFEELWEVGLRCSQYDEWRRLLDNLHDDPKITGGTEGTYLKLHGSIDVHVCLNRSCEQYRRPITSRKSTTGTAFVERLGLVQIRCPTCGSQAFGWIVPPGENKSGNELIFSDVARTRALEALGNSSAWVIVGYSLPEYDEDVISLFREAIRRDPIDRPVRRTVYVVGPDSVSVANRLQEIIDYPVFPNVDGFSDLVDAVLGVSGVKRPILTWDDNQVGQNPHSRRPDTIREAVILEYPKSSD